MEMNNYLSVKSIAKMLEINKRTVWKFVEDGRLPPPAIRYGRKFTRWLKDDIENATKLMENSSS